MSDQPGTMQMDMARIVERATQAAATLAVAPLAAELGAAREALAVHGERIAQLEQALADKEAELARSRQTTELLRQQLDSPTEQTAGPQPEGPGEG